MLPKKHALSKVIANIGVLGININDPLFSSQRFISLSYDGVAELVKATGTTEKRAVALFAKPALWPETLEVFKTAVEALPSVETTAVSSWLHDLSSFYLRKLLGGRKGVKFPDYSGRYVRSQDKLGTNTDMARWCCHLLCAVGEIIYKEDLAAYTKFLDYVFNRTLVAPESWKEIEVLNKNSTVGDLLAVLVKFEQLRKVTVDEPKEEVVTTTTPVQSIAEMCQSVTTNGLSQLTVVADFVTLTLYQANWDLVVTLAESRRQNFVLARIGRHWYIADPVLRGSIDALVEQLANSVQLESLIVHYCTKPVIRLGSKVFFTDGSNLIEFGKNGFIPYGPLPQNDQ